MRFLQANCQEFADRRLLPSAVAEKVRELWNPNWRAQLALEINPDPTDVRIREGNQMTRWFHVKVWNLHGRKLALHCYVYLKHAKNLETDKEIPLETAEFKWTGSPLPAVMIGPKSFRSFDAICILHQK